MCTKEDFNWIKQLLPNDYICETRDWGIHCHSKIGICDDHKNTINYNPETDNHWELIVKAIKQRFGNNLLEIYSQEPQTHTKFTVYLKDY